MIVVLKPGKIGECGGGGFGIAKSDLICIGSIALIVVQHEDKMQCNSSSG